MALSISRKGGCFMCMEIPAVGYTYSIGIVEIFLRQKEGYYKYYLYIYIVINIKLIILVIWTSRDQISLDFLSRSQPVA
jgi:hypothetical protein